MTERMIVNRVRKLKELEAQQKEIEEQIEALKAEIKADMPRKDLEARSCDLVLLLLRLCFSWLTPQPESLKCRTFQNRTTKRCLGLRIEGQNAVGSKPKWQNEAPRCGRDM